MALPDLKSEASPEPRTQVVHFQSQAVIKASAAPKRADLPAKQRVIACERLMFVREVWKLTEQGNTEADAVAAASTRTENYPTLVTAGKKGASALTIYNYRSWRRKLGVRRGTPNFDNLDALTDRYGLNVRGAFGAPEFWKVFNSLYYNENKLSIPKARNDAVRVCQKNGITDVPSLRQIRYWLNTHADQAALLVARHGETWAENNVMGYIRRDWSEVAPNEIWIGDHHVFDCYVRAFNAEKSKWEAVRPWLTAWMDGKSLRFTGVNIGFDSPSSVSIMTALQNGIRLNGNTPPKRLYSDNGADFLKTGFSEPFTPKDTEHQHSVCAELGTGVIRTMPYRARAKTVERIFKEVCEGFSKKWAAYLGNRPDARPEIANAFAKEPELLPSLDQFCQAFAQWVGENYHSKTQDGKILDGKSPDQVWIKGTGGTRFTDEELWFSMLLPYTRNCPTVGRGAAVVVDGEEYRSEELWPFFRDKVMVKLDVVNGGPPVAFTLDGKLIGPLKPVDTAPAIAKTAEGRQLVSEGMKRQGRELKRAYGIINELTNGMWKLAPQETLSLRPGAGFEIIKHDFKRKSVKGGSHNFILHTVKPEEQPTDKASDAVRELTKGEEKTRKIAAFNRKQVDDDDDEIRHDPNEVSDFQNMITNKRRRNDDEESWQRDR